MRRELRLGLRSPAIREFWASKIIVLYTSMMTNISSILTELSDQDVLARVHRAAQDERCATAHLIALLVELDARRLYLGEGCSSLFTYCTQVLYLSEHAAYNRIETARGAAISDNSRLRREWGRDTDDGPLVGAAPDRREFPRGARASQAHEQTAGRSACRDAESLAGCSDSCSEIAHTGHGATIGDAHDVDTSSGN
jgi:hypothetical protein